MTRKCKSHVHPIASDAWAFGVEGRLPAHRHSPVSPSATAESRPSLIRSYALPYCRHSSDWRFDVRLALVSRLVFAMKDYETLPTRKVSSFVTDTVARGRDVASSVHMAHARLYVVASAEIPGAVPAAASGPGPV